MLISECYRCNLLKVIGSVGHPIKHTEFKVVDSETDEVLPPGSKGILKVRGPQVMEGYFKVICFVRMKALFVCTSVLLWVCVCARERKRIYVY